MSNLPEPKRPDIYIAMVVAVISQRPGKVWLYEERAMNHVSSRRSVLLHLAFSPASSYTVTTCSFSTPDTAHVLETARTLWV